MTLDQMKKLINNNKALNFIPKRFCSQENFNQIFKCLEFYFEQPEDNLYISCDEAQNFMDNYFLPLMFSLGYKIQKTRTLKSTLSIDDLLEEKNLGEGPVISFGMRMQIQDFNHLPTPIRDFHTQKYIFKSIDLLFPDSGISWVKAHVYTVDHFLYILAVYGYTLQKIPRKEPSFTIDDLINNLKSWERSQFSLSKN